MPGQDLVCHAVEATPGDGVVLSGSVYHAVFGQQPGRTYLALKFCKRPKTSRERASLWRNYGGSVRLIVPILRSRIDRQYRRRRCRVAGSPPPPLVLLLLLLP